METMEHSDMVTATAVIRVIFISPRLYSSARFCIRTNVNTYFSREPSFGINSKANYYIHINLVARTSQFPRSLFWYYLLWLGIFPTLNAWFYVGHSFPDHNITVIWFRMRKLRKNVYTFVVSNGTIQKRCTNNVFAPFQHAVGIGQTVRRIRPKKRAMF